MHLLNQQHDDGDGGGSHTSSSSRHGQGHGGGAHGSSGHGSGGFMTYCSEEFECKYMTAQEVQHQVRRQHLDIAYVWAR